MHSPPHPRLHLWNLKNISSATKMTTTKLDRKQMKNRLIQTIQQSENSKAADPFSPLPNISWHRAILDLGCLLGPSFFTCSTAVSSFRMDVIWRQSSPWENIQCALVCACSQYCVCMCVCLSVSVSCMCVCMCMHVCVCACVSVSVYCVCECECVRVHVCVCVCVCVCMHRYMCVVCTCTCVCGGVWGGGGEGGGRIFTRKMQCMHSMTFSSLHFCFLL